MTDRAPCYYCDGTGIVEVQTDVDRWDGRGRCGECNGSGVSSRRAGDRNTKAPLPVYSFGARFFAGDVLIHLARTRQQLARCRHDRLEQWRMPSLRAQYAHFRKIAFEARPCSTST